VTGNDELVVVDEVENNSNDTAFSGKLLNPIIIKIKRKPVEIIYPMNFRKVCKLELE